jgi:chaperone modulatory protein CbpM
MKTEYLISLIDFCNSHDIEVSFISSLHETGLINITRIENKDFLDAQQLQQLEKYIRFYYELNINLEGIDSIKHLLQRVNTLQNEIITLRNRLRLYEADLS